MKTMSLIVLALFGQETLARVECRQMNAQHFYVFETSSQKYIGNGSYSSLEFCLNAIDSDNPTMTCARHLEGSALFSIPNGSVIGYKNSYFTSVNYCNRALRSVRDGVICIPSNGAIQLFDTKYRYAYPAKFFSTEACQYASGSASTKDQFMCGPNGTGLSSWVDRSTAQAIGDGFASTEECSEALNAAREGRVNNR